MYVYIYIYTYTYTYVYIYIYRDIFACVPMTAQLFLGLSRSFGLITSSGIIDYSYNNLSLSLYIYTYIHRIQYNTQHLHNTH